MSDQFRAHALSPDVFFSTAAWVTRGLKNLAHELNLLLLRYFRVSATLRSPALLMLTVLLTPFAVVAAALGFWKFGSDPGWTTHFLISTGLFWHCQAWFALAIAAQITSHWAKQWQETQLQEAQARGSQIPRRS